MKIIRLKLLLLYAKGARKAMPSKVFEAVQAIKAARGAVQDVVNMYGIDISSDGIKVQVGSLRDLEQIPGDVEYKEFAGGRLPDYPIRARKFDNGVEWFCLLDPEQSNGLNLCCLLPGTAQEMAATA